MKTRQLIKELYRRYPLNIAEANEDYVGLMVGKLPLDVHKILLCLDMDETIFSDVLEFRPDLIITHHPFIYGEKKEVFAENPHKEDLYRLLKNHNFPVFSIHTNFDGGTPGMNDTLAKMLDLKGIYTPEKELCMRIGTLDREMKINDFVKYAKDRLGASYGLLIDKGKKKIKKVAIIGGGGARFYKIAMEEGADIYISGDMSHYVRRDIIIDRYNYLDLPHEIERVFMPTIANEIKKIDGSIELKIVDHEKEAKLV